MNKRNVYSTLIYKEFMILKRQTLLLIFSVAVPILVIGTSWLLAFGSLEDNKDPNIIRYMLAFQMITVSLYTIPTISLMFFSKNVNDERKEKTNNVLISIGIDQKTIWISKITCIIGFSIICFWAFIILYIFIGRLIFGVFISTQPLLLILSLIVMPLVSISVSLVLCLMFWLMKNTSIISFIPSILMFFAYYINMKFLQSNFNYMIILLAIFATVMILFICIKIINSVSNEYISNL